MRFHPSSSLGPSILGDMQIRPDGVFVYDWDCIKPECKNTTLETSTNVGMMCFRLNGHSVALIQFATLCFDCITQSRSVVFYANTCIPLFLITVDSESKLCSVHCTNRRLCILKSVCSSLLESVDKNASPLSDNGLVVFYKKQFRNKFLSVAWLKNPVWTTAFWSRTLVRVQMASY